MQLTVIYDNYLHDKRLKNDWGFACLVRLDGKTILFDTGADGKIFLSNMEKLNIDPSEIDLVAFSHIHWDHVGGLDSFLEKNGDVDVYVPVSFPDSFEAFVGEKGGRLHRVDKPAAIIDGVYTTGDLEGEAALAIDTPKGIIVITGCAHPGVTRLIERAKQVTGRPVELVVGGFHLLDMSESEVKAIIAEFRRLGVRTAAPSHCTGDKAIELFHRDYGDDCIRIGAGWSYKP